MLQFVLWLAYIDNNSFKNDTVKSTTKTPLIPAYFGKKRDKNPEGWSLQTLDQAVIRY